MTADIRSMDRADVPAIVAAFAAVGWPGKSADV